MEIIKSSQYNQGIGKFKVLSSTAGVGSIVPNKWGGFVMPITSSDWGMISAVNKYLKKDEDKIIKAQEIADETGVEIIEDYRFVGFLKKAEGMRNLRCLAAIPHVSLSIGNYCEVSKHPLNVRYKEHHSGSRGLEEGIFTVPAVVFPRWFYSRKTSDLLLVDDWLRMWKEMSCNDGQEQYFAPPRDPNFKTNRTIKDEHLPKGKDHIHALLEQVSMVLICPNGHISDIPWDKYFSAKLEQGDGVSKVGFDLFGYEGRSCPDSDTGQHQLQWLENRNHSESFGTLKCKCCKKTVSLEGIMNLQPSCPGERPWEGIGRKDYIACRNRATGEASTMKWAMVTSNSVYYAENFSSLYIPDCYRKDDGYLDDKQLKVLNLLESRWYFNYSQKNPDKSKDDYVKNITIEELIEKASDSNYDLSEEEMKKIVNVFLGVDNHEEVADVREEYRFSEFKVFENNKESMEESDLLRFKDVNLSDLLSRYFDKIQQVNTLGISTTQINFSRVSMPQPTINDDGTVDYPKRMKIFKESPEDVLVMPANQSYGEGLFFSFNEETLRQWEQDCGEAIRSHYQHIANHDETYEHVYQEMDRGGVSRFFLLHSFSHALMKELEFRCGYPTASLKERLYFSNRMCGVLIYTADGAEGSMGGLVWQGQRDLIEDIISKAMQRAMNCASDPICWENEDQLNYAACFSCMMVSETCCEKRNVGLDRRILVDPEFGYFRGLI